VNAIEHGNLGISYEEKTKALDEDKLNEVILTKSREPELAKRRVTVRYRLTHEKVTYDIEDEGDGFDVSHLPNPGDPENLWLGHGRGILMTRALMDEVIYNEKGNKVTLVKNVPSMETLEVLEEPGKPAGGKAG
jgi:anti-sigma regulatory factor (Ser/Thr protein kinase)